MKPRLNAPETKRLKIRSDSLAVQVDPMKPKLISPGTKRLKLKSDHLLSTLAFNFNLRRYMMACDESCSCVPEVKCECIDKKSQKEMCAARVH
jgi:hypothetical protein